MNVNSYLMVRLSLAFLWIFSGLTSVWFDKETGYAILATANITGSLAAISLIAGSLLDVTIGLWLISGWQLRWCCWGQALVIVVYTVLITVLSPDYWLHPFGPVTKNIPLLVLIMMLYQHSVSLAEQSDKQADVKK